MIFFHCVYFLLLCFFLSAFICTAWACIGTLPRCASTVSFLPYVHLLFFIPRVIIAAYAWNLSSMTCLSIRLFFHALIWQRYSCLSPEQSSDPFYHLFMHELLKNNNKMDVTEQSLRNARISNAVPFIDSPVYFFHVKSIQNISQTKEYDLLSFV